MKLTKLTTKRFVIRKSLIGKNVIITFTNKKNVECTYNHDKVYNCSIIEILEIVSTFAKLEDIVSITKVTNVN